MRSDAGPSYLDIGKWRIRVPRRRGTRIALGFLILVRGLVPTPTSPILLPAAITLLSKDISSLRRWRRRLTVALYRRQARFKLSRAVRHGPGKTESRLAHQG
jgi:hypothetical protein